MVGTRPARARGRLGTTLDVLASPLARPDSTTRCNSADSCSHTRLGANNRAASARASSRITRGSRSSSASIRTTVAATVDPNVHTRLVRSEVLDPAHQLLPGMFANFMISTGAPVTATAVPVDAVVREGDGTMTVWVTTDRHTFTQRQVMIGLQHDGYDQIVDGLKQGELVVTDNAVFLDNMLTAGPTD